MSEVECENCGGTGEVTCDRCGGTGSLPGFATWGGGFTSCDVCYGSGYIPCLECNGDGYIEKDDEEDDNGSVFNESNNSPLPITGEHSVIHTDMGRTYTINNKKYLLTNQGFRREHNGNIYRFSYEKSMELIKNVEAVLMDETDKALIDHIYIVNNKKYVLTSQGFMRENNENTYYFPFEKSLELINSGQATLQTNTVKEHPTVHSDTENQSDDLVSININSEVIEKITYTYHNKMVMTYNKNGKKFHHWGVPYSLFLDYVNSANHFHFRKHLLKGYEVKPSSAKIIDDYRYIYDEVFGTEDREWLSENGIFPIKAEGLTFVTYYDTYEDNGNKLKIKFYEFKLLNPFTCEVYRYDSHEYEDQEGYMFHISPSLSTSQIRALCEIFEDKEDWEIYELFNIL